MPADAEARPAGRFGVDWSDTNTAVAAMVIGSVLALIAIRRGFRGFTLNT